MKQKKRHHIGVKVGLAVILIGILSGYAYLSSDHVYSQIKLDVLNKYLEIGYIGEIDKKAVSESMLAGYVGALGNPLTSYLDQTAYKIQKIREEGKGYGIGLNFQWTLDENHLIITDVIEGSPADQAGLKVGDKITSIGGVKVILSNESSIYEKVYNADDQEVEYIVEDNSGNNERVIILKNAVLEQDDIKSDLIQNVGYIKLQTVKEGTSKVIKDQINTFKAQSVKGIIFDIRGISTNNISEVQQICELFTKEDSGFKVKDKGGKFMEYTCEGGRLELDTVILLDSNTSGIAEALPIALKNHVKLIGSKTAGEGYLTELVSLDDDTGIRVAVGILCDRQGNELADKGILPDLEITNTIDAIIELLETGKISYKNDSALMAAIEEFQ